MKYYVYIYFDPRIKSSFKYGELEFEYEPFYVGKGKGQRYLSHLKQKADTYKVRKIKSIRSAGYEPFMIKYKDGLSEKEAYDLEIELIKTIGRKNLRTGPLANIHDGGTFGTASGATNGFYGKHHTKETKEKQRIGYEKYFSDPIKKKEWLKKTRKERKLVESKGFSGMLHSKESKEKMSFPKQIGRENSQFGTCWITKNKENKKIKRNELKSFILDGWIPGRIIK
jgi:hypothetical protein